MRYTIRHGSIASVQYVTCPDGRTVTVTDSKEQDAGKDNLPAEVLEKVNDQFEAVFALPYERRQSFIDSAEPVPVDILGSLFQELNAVGVECSNWQSDLYFPVTEQTRAILAKFPGQSRSTFKSNIDGRLMFECPFAFDPFWQAKKKD